MNLLHIIIAIALGALTYFVALALVLPYLWAVIFGFVVFLVYLLSGDRFTGRI